MPMPSEDSPMLEQTTTLLDSNGCSDPLQKIYVTSDPLEGLPVLLLLFTTTYMQKFAYSTDFGTLVRGKSTYPLDGWPLSVGVSTLLKQFHPGYAKSTLAYLGQFVRATVVESAARAAAGGRKGGGASGGGGAAQPREVVNTLVFAKQICETMNIPKGELHEHFPQFLMESLTLL